MDRRRRPVHRARAAHRPPVRAGASAALAVLVALLAPAPATAAEEVHRLTVSDGTSLRATLSGDAPLRPRPTVVEFTPYGRAGGVGDAVPGTNRLTVELRGTGDSGGAFDALGPRTQQDVEETLRWACAQPWIAGRLGLTGFSASAITVYNSLHRHLPCVEAAVLGSGTHELYRDLLVPGGISNLVPGAGVVLGIGLPALAQGPDRLARDPLSAITTLVGLLDAGLNDLLRPHLDDWWRERGMRGSVNRFPILMTDGFFDVESRGAFQAYQELRRHSRVRLVVGGAHDQPPAGTDGGRSQRAAWFRRFLLGEDNGVERRPAVELLLADGDRQAYVGGRFVRASANDWPVPGTRWTALRLDAAPSGSGPLVGDGSLGTGPPRRTGTLAYAALPSILTATDPPNAAVIGGAADGLTAALPVLRDMNLSEQLGRSFTTPPLREDVLAAGPAALQVRLGTSTPSSAIWAVVSDVSPDGVAHAVAAGRLNTSYPEVDPDRSLRDRTGAIVQPYGRYDRPAPAPQGTPRDYQVELWPIGNRFRAGHRIRLTVLGASLGSPLSPPGVQTLEVAGSTLRLPALPGSDLPFALGGPRTPADPAGPAAAPSARPRVAVGASPRRLRAGRVVRLRVRVRSGTPRCRVGVRVSASGARARTDARGRATLRLRPARATRLAVVARTPGCRVGRTTVRVR